MKFTSYEEIYTRFLNKIEDYDLFQQIKVDPDFVNGMLFDLLKSAITHFTYTDINFNEIMNDDTETFTSPLADIEKEILARLMIVEYMSPKLIRTEVFEQRLGSKDFQTYSPGNLLKQLRELRKEEESRTNTLMLQYYYMEGV